MFLMEEESSCWCRACCNPAQPALVKFYNSSPPQLYVTYYYLKTLIKILNVILFDTSLSPSSLSHRMPASGCGPCKKEPYNRYNKVGTPVLTWEKNGNCDNCAQCGPTNCFVCCSKCQSKAWLHNGDIPSVRTDKGCGPCKVAHWEFPEGTPGLADQKNKLTAISEATVPIFGGGCTPTVNVMRRSANNEMEQFAVVEGPTCFGGCMDLCCTTEFKVSRAKGKAGGKSFFGVDAVFIIYIIQYCLYL